MMPPRADEQNPTVAAPPVPPPPPTPSTPPTSTVPPTPAAPIEYGLSGQYMTRRQGRVLMGLTLLNLALLSWFVFGPNTSQMVQGKWQQWQAARADRATRKQVAGEQQQCLDHVLPPKPLLIYQEDPAVALKLARDHAAYAPVRMSVTDLLATTAAWASPVMHNDPPAAWSAFARSATSTNGVAGGLGCNADLPVVFMGRRRVAVTGAPEERLVVVQFESRPEWRAGEPGLDKPRMLAARRLHASTFTIGTGAQQPRRLRTETLHLILPPTSAQLNGAGDAWVITRPVLFSIFTGAADGADAAHFTIPYKLNGYDGVIDGWLHAQGPLLKPRTGDAVNFGGSERAWNMVVPPATQPEHFHVPPR